MIDLEQLPIELASVLSTLKADSTLVEVYEYEPSEVPGYPYVIISTPDNPTSTNATNKQTQMEVSMTATVVTEMTPETTRTMLEKSRDHRRAVTKVMELVNDERRADNPLGGEIDFIRPINSTQQRIVAETPVIRTTIRITCVKIIEDN